MFLFILECVLIYSKHYIAEVLTPSEKHKKCEGECTFGKSKLKMIVQYSLLFKVQCFFRSKRYEVGAGLPHRDRGVWAEYTPRPLSTFIKLNCIVKNRPDILQFQLLLKKHFKGI